MGKSTSRKIILFPPPLEAGFRKLKLEMIQIEQIHDLPHLPWATNTAEQVSEVFRTKESILNRSKEIYLLRNSKGAPLLVVGLMQTNFVSGWHIWTMVCKCDLKRYVRTLRKMLHILVKQLGYIMITVDKAFPVGQRFAEFLGFRLTSEVDSIDNKTYCFYGMDKAWLTQ